MTAGPVALSHKDMGTLKVVNLGNGTDPTDAVTKGQLDTAETDAKSRANHTGSQTASTISDFDTQVRTSRLDQMAAPTGSVSANSQKIISLADGTGANDAVNKSQLDAALAGLVSGLAFKGSVRAAVATNVDIASAPATLDGITPSPGDVFLLMGQTTGSQNGPRVWTSAGATLARASNWDTSGEAVVGSFWDVREGTSADTFALLSTDSAITLDTTSLAFVIRGGSAGTTGYTATCPTTSAGGSWTVTHNLGSKKLLAQVARVASPYDFVDVRLERTDNNTVTVKPDIGLASGEYEIMIEKVA